MNSEPFAKMITCPEHPNGRVYKWDIRKHQAILFLEGSKYAGIWECTRTGASDVCEHEETHVEHMSGYWPTQEQIDRGTDHDEEWDQYVCDLCGVAIDLDVADPAEDRAEALADMQIMEALGK